MPFVSGSLLFLNLGDMTVFWNQNTELNWKQIHTQSRSSVECLAVAVSGPDPLAINK